MYSGVIGREYRDDRSKKNDTYTLESIGKARAHLYRKEKCGSHTNETFLNISIKSFQNWIDCKHQMYVRQVGEVTLPFPDEDC